MLNIYRVIAIILSYVLKLHIFYHNVFHNVQCLIYSCVLNVHPCKTFILSFTDICVCVHVCMYMCVYLHLDPCINTMYKFITNL